MQLPEKFDQLENLLLNHRDSIGIHNGVPFILLIYSPDMEIDCRKKIKNLHEKLESKDLSVLNIPINLAIFDHLKKDGVLELLELQTLSEDFGRIGLGRIWLIITSQEKLEQVVEGVKIKQEGYKKIMDRFETKLHLTSENIVAVLQERILKKKEKAIPEISSVYSKFQGAIAYSSKLEGANHPQEIH